MNRRVLVVSVMSAAIAYLAAPVVAQELRLTPLVRDGRVYVSFVLGQAFSDDLRAAIRSGLPTTFTYEVGIRRGRSLWFDRTVASATVSATVRYDNLTRRYQVTRMIDGRMEGTPEVTDNEDVVREVMTEFDKLALFGGVDLEPNVEYYLQVRARTSPRSAWFIWPWGRHTASSRATFTVIP